MTDNPTTPPDRLGEPRPQRRDEDRNMPESATLKPTAPLAMRDLILPGGDDSGLPQLSSKDALTAYLAGLGAGSRRTTMVALNRVARLFGLAADAVPWERLRHEHVAAIRSELQSRHTPATANASLAGVKGVLKSAWRLGLMTTDDFTRAVDVRGVRGSRLPAGRALDHREIARLLRACAADRTASGRRDAALIALMAGAGLRRSEAASLTLSDYDSDDEAVQTVGKGSKERRVYLLRGGAQLLDAWIAERGTEPGPLLVKITRQGQIIRDGRGMTPQALMLRVQRRAAQAAGLGKVTPHDLRRSFVTALLESGADVLTTQRLAGHASAATTALYDRRPDQEARKAAQSVRLG